jgi:hypothetical protein
VQSIKSDAEDRQELRHPRISAVINEIRVIAIRRYRARLISFRFRPHSGDIYRGNKKKLPFSIRTDSFRAEIRKRAVSSQSETGAGGALAVKINAGGFP